MSVTEVVLMMKAVGVMS